MYKRQEGLCARWACDNITKDQLDELEENIYLSDFHSSKGNSEQVVELDNKMCIRDRGSGDAGV